MGERNVSEVAHQRTPLKFRTKPTT